MPSGSYILIPSAGTLGGNWYQFAGTALGIVQGTGVAVGTNEARIDTGGTGSIRADFHPETSIFLDGSLTPTPQGELPVGFTPLTAITYISGFSISAGSTYWHQFDIATESASNIGLTFAYPGSLPNMADLMVGGMGLRYSSAAAVHDNIIGYVGNGPWKITGTWEAIQYQWYLEEVEEVYERIRYKRNVLTQVTLGDTPPDGAIPFGALDEDPTYIWWEYNVDGILLYLYQPISPGTAWIVAVAPTNYGWWKSFEEYLGGALLIVNGNPKKPRTFEQITDFSDFMGGFPGAGATLNHRLIYAAKDT